METCNYTFKKEGEAALMSLSDGPQIGFIFQQLEEEFPTLVRNDVNAIPDYKHTGKKTGINYKGVNYIGMIPVLTQAIKEQQDMINNQKQEIDKLKSENEYVKLRLEKLEKLIMK